MNIDRSIYRDFSKIFLDVVKYVLTGVILSLFIGNFRDNSPIVYIVSFAVLSGAVLLYLLFHKIGKEN
jgi:hypothetical protein